MKTTIRHFFALALAAIVPFAFAGCNLATVNGDTARVATTANKTLAQGGQILSLIGTLPASVKKDIGDAIAKYPVAATDLNLVATGIESLAVDANAHPLPATLNNTLVSWVELVPGKVGAIATAVSDAYAVAAPVLQKIPNALTAIGEFIRTFEPPQPAASIAQKVAQEVLEATNPKP